MSSTYGESLKLSIWGQSHGPAIGMTLDGIPAGLATDFKKLQAFLNRRSPGQFPWTTSRREEDKPEFEAKSAALVPVLKRKQKAFFHAHRADDLFTAIRIAKEFDLDAVLVHATEGHLIAEDLKTEGYPVITGPILCDRSKPELRNLTIENPAKLAAAGVLQAICTDHPVIPIQYLPLSAGLAIRGGLSRKEAMRMITRNPAVICGLDDRIGSLKAGKDADFVIFEGDPFTVYFKPEKVYINGCLVNQQED